MRSSPRLFRASSAALILASLAACEKKTTQEAPSAPEKIAPPKSVSAEPTSFDAVARFLDSGGGLYGYLSTEGFAKSASEVIQQMQKAIEAQAKVSPEQKAQMEAAWNTFKPFLSNSGIKEISGVGISSLAIRPGYYRTKSIFHHYKEKGTGFLWKLNGGQARALDLINYLPESTAAAGSLDLTLEPIWAELIARAAGNNELRSALDQLQTQVKAGSGLDLPALLAGLGPNYSYVVTLDESNPFTLPHDGTSDPLTIPEPRVALLIQIRDEAVLNEIDQRLSALPMVTAADQGDLKLRKINVPLPFPFLSPTIAWKNDLLVISSNEALLNEMLEIKEGKKPGLGATERFKKVMADLPSPASTFGYVDPLFNKTIMAVQMQSIKNQPGMGAGMQQLMQSLYNLQLSEAQAGVGQNTPEGWFSVTNGGPGPKQIASIGAVVPAMLSAIALPNFLRTRQRSEATRTLDELRLIEASIDQWALENKKRPGDQPTTDDLKVYLKNGTPLYNNMAANPGATTVILISHAPAVTIPPVDGKLKVPKEIVEHFSKATSPSFWGAYYQQ